RADAAPPRRLVELELPPHRGARRPHHGHLLDEPPAEARRAAAILPHPEPERGDRPGQGPATLYLRPPRLHRRRRRRPAPPGGGQRRAPHPLRRRLVGLGLPRGRRGQRAAGVRGDRGYPPGPPGPTFRCRGGAGGLTESAIYEGWVRHRRFDPVEHSFRYRFFLAYLDLTELPEVLDRFPLYSARRRAVARFRRSDYLG